MNLNKVEIEIEDLNDNSPVFPDAERTIHVVENAQIGTEIRLDSATDADTKEHDIEKYFLGDDERLVPNQFFELKERIPKNFA